MAKNRQWMSNGVRLGFIRGDVYYIDRMIRGERYTISTRRRTEDGAYEEYRKFELDPDTYAKDARAAAPQSWGRLVGQYLDWAKNIKDTSEKHRVATAKRLEDWGAFPGFTSPDAFTKSDVEAFVRALREGRVTHRERMDYVRGEVVKVPSCPGQPTVNRYLASLKGFMHWCRDNDVTHNDADTRVRMAKEHRNVRPPQSVEKNGGRRWRRSWRRSGGVPRRFCWGRACGTASSRG